MGWTRRRPRSVLAAAAALLALAAYWRALPDPLFDELVATVLYARDGTLLGARIAADGQWRFPPLAAVPEKYRHAAILYEDKRFEHHPGVDPLALARAAKLNLARGAIVSGGSTITMQVIRLARGNPARGYLEKLVEAALALRLELSHGKDEVLALYASHAPFGGNVVGLEAAAWRYFGRGPERLSWAEAALLAVLPNSPALIHPGRNRDGLQEKRDRLLRRLATEGHLSPLDLDLALREPLPGEPLALPQLAPHLLETLRAEHPGEPRLRTTVDASLQRAIQEIVERHGETLRRQDIHNAAALVIDNRSFEVLAYVGNAQWSVANERGYAVDIVRRPRSTGSLLKPFLYAAMLDAGEVLPTTLVADIPTQYSGYIPENFDRAYRGAVPAQVALAQSLNVPAVRMLKTHGIERFYDLLRDMGMTTLRRAPQEYGLTLILGGAEGTLWELTALYATLADLARRDARDARAPYRRIAARAQGEDVNGRGAEISPAAAWLTLQALLEVARPADEAHWRNFATSRRIAWKTGTSFGLRDAWAIGASGRYTVGVWAGNASGEGRPGLTGSLAAAPLLFEIFNRFEPAQWLEAPLAQMKVVEVCRADGYLAAGQCESVSQWAPRHSHFDATSPHHSLVHLDRAGRYRVHGGCESPARMTHRAWFVLPPAQEFFYRRHHADYRAMPRYRKDCLAEGGGSRGPIDFLYPNIGTRIYIPVDLAGERGRAVFEAAHRDPEATLYWHLDEQYIGATRTFHQQALDISPGAHTVTVVDGDGNRLARRFDVLSKDR